MDSKEQDVLEYNRTSLKTWFSQIKEDVEAEVTGQSAFILR